MYKDKKFINQDVLIDGQRFFNCRFIESRIVFRGTAPVQFEDCVFTECQWVFDGPAENTLRFLSALANDLGPEANAMVVNMLQGIVLGQIDNVLAPTRPPVAV
ncbi:MAG: hypothetical protein M3Q50_09300 [Chloroflexota bacterium]|nr:hypothetical protein [Chloroflexota bacterium]